eukprot:CAMPEP_0177232722 /NCGR_PEP_ID=MMETSP0367-20130122/43475_1 /TAXON_ID=447022 ORGANISM="Scrippsiella hangoei-like, Strain SHHI-4" /NCGR_SAMPLE_ID=MMETSP0367 /ASSEMBLY_ACC=CAM_ASM_000362 /LENGTH=51 /DNA_ID=CAMNT_0018683389 /DNA_START=75 /DNA_END=227 /DNA_ORIENTATION=+
MSSQETVRINLPSVPPGKMPRGTGTGCVGGAAAEGVAKRGGRRPSDGQEQT